MIIPVRCFTCHKVLGDKWEYYKREMDEHEKSVRRKVHTSDNLGVSSEVDIFFTDNHAGKVLDHLGLTKLCCRRHMLTHTDLIDII
jgi:DNA-directed RNA polymerase subunit N (RpoN/RPB10)